MTKTDLEELRRVLRRGWSLETSSQWLPDNPARGHRGHSARALPNPRGLRRLSLGIRIATLATVQTCCPQSRSADSRQASKPRWSCGGSGSWSSGFIPEQAETIVLRPTPDAEPAAHVVGRIAPTQ